MEVDSVGDASTMVASALAAKNENRMLQAQTSVLRKQLDNEQAAAAQLLQMMGVGQNLNVVG